MVGKSAQLTHPPPRPFPFENYSIGLRRNSQIGLTADLHFRLNWFGWAGCVVRDIDLPVFGKGADRQAVDLVKYHLGWKLALNLKLSEGGFLSDDIGLLPATAD